MSKNTPAQLQYIAAQIKMGGGFVFGGLECVFLICAHRANTGLATWRKSPVKRSGLSSCLNSYRRVSTTPVPHCHCPSCCICPSGTYELVCHSGLLSSICASRSANFLEMSWMLWFKYVARLDQDQLYILSFLLLRRAVRYINIGD